MEFELVIALSPLQPVAPGMPKAPSGTSDGDLNIHWQR